MQCWLSWGIAMASSNCHVPWSLNFKPPMLFASSWWGGRKQGYILYITQNWYHSPHFAISGAYLIVYIRAEYQTMYRHDAYMPTLVLNHCFNLDTIHKESKWNVLWRMLAWSLRYSCVYLSWKREPISFFQVTWKQLSGALEIIRWLVLRVLKLSPYWSMTLFQ